MRDTFDALIGPLADELHAKRRREADERRRRLPRAAGALACGTLITAVVGVLNPVVGLVVFLATTLLGSRAIGRILATTR